MRIIKDVYWPEKMKLYFEQTMRVTPAQYKNFASGTLVREIEDKTRERNATEVAEQDLVKAFLDSIPVFFRGDMIKLLKDLGIDISRPKEEKPQVRDMIKIKEDIIKAVELAGVTYNEAIIDKVLKTYELAYTGFRTSISFSTTTKRAEHRGLSVHYVDVYNPHNPFQMAVDNQLLLNNELPIDKFVGEVSKMVPVLGYGLDFGVMTGIEQINVMCASHLQQPIEKVAVLKSAPDSLRTNMPLLGRFHLKYGIIFSVNYLKSAAMIQFMTNQIAKFDTDYIENILKAVDYKIPQKGVLELCTKAIAIMVEFPYARNQLNSISFQMCVHSIDEIPKNLNSFVENYAKNAPFLTDTKKYIYVVTFTRSGQYLKIQNDYSGTTVDSITGPFNQKAFADSEAERNGLR